MSRATAETMPAESRAKRQRRGNEAPINIRAKRPQRDLIDQAAARVGRSRSDFMLDAACRAAEDVLLDQTFFQLKAADFAKFKALLDNPRRPNKKLRALLTAKTPW